MPQTALHLHTHIENYPVALRGFRWILILWNRGVSGCANIFQLCLFNSGRHHSSMLWDSCINMSWPFKLSPHITNLNLNEPPLQIHQQAMTLHPLLGPGPSPYSILLPPATHIHQQAIISRYPSIPPHTHARTPFCRNPTSCTVLIWLRGGGQGEGEMVGDHFIAMTF